MLSQTLFMPKKTIVIMPFFIRPQSHPLVAPPTMRVSLNHVFIPSKPLMRSLNSRTSLMSASTCKSGNSLLSSFSTLSRNFRASSDTSSSPLTLPHHLLTLQKSTANIKQTATAVTASGQFTSANSRNVLSAGQAQRSASMQQLQTPTEHGPLSPLRLLSRSIAESIVAAISQFVP